VAGTGYKEQATIWCLDPRDATVVWSKTLDEGLHPSETGLAVTEDTVVVGVHNGDVFAFHAPTGDQPWTSSVADLTWRRLNGQVEPGRVRDRPSVFGGHVILDVYDHYVVSLALGDGSRAWAWGGPPFVVRDGQLLDDKYYVLGWAGEYRILDAGTGREVFATDLGRQLPRDLLGIGLAPPLLVTSSHVLAGSERGHVTAFARDTGEFAWSYRPPGGESTEYGPYRFVVGDQRIYFGDATFRIRCLAPTAKKAPRRSC